MCVNAADVIGKVLDRGGSPDEVLAALDKAGMSVLEPLPELAPPWLPTTKHGMHLVRHATLLAAKGLTREEMAAALGKSKRMVDRYLAAAAHLGLLNTQPRSRRPR